MEDNALYQCPYEKACMCKMDEPCLGCEEFAVYLTKKEKGDISGELPISSTQHLKYEISALADAMEMELGVLHREKDKLYINKLRQLSAV